MADDTVARSINKFIYIRVGGQILRIYLPLSKSKMLAASAIKKIRPMNGRQIHRLLSYFIATVWIANGLFCKVLNLVPRHEQIVARILGDTYSRPLTILIGFSEIGVAIWILSGIKIRLNTLLQIVIIATMNTLEFILVPNLLLWGKFNSVFAFLFIIVVYLNEFYLNKQLAQQI